jgi:hypothetical protein
MTENGQYKQKIQKKSKTRNVNIVIFQTKKSAWFYYVWLSCNMEQSKAIINLFHAGEPIPEPKTAIYYPMLRIRTNFDRIRI